MNNPRTERQSHASSVNAIKKRIRDVSRRLERADDLPANVRLDDERALAAYEQELAAAEVEKNRQKMIKKYHMVRFFGMPVLVPSLGVVANPLCRTSESYKGSEEASKAITRVYIRGGGSNLEAENARC